MSGTTSRESSSVSRTASVRLPNLMVSRFSLPARRTITSTDLPTPAAPTTCFKCPKFRIFTPLNSVITSPRRMPPFSAGLPLPTCVTWAPCGLSMLSFSARSKSTGLMLMPSQPRTTFPFSMSCGMILRAMLLGMANPMPMFPVVKPPVAIKVLMPTSSPRMLISAPPLLPRLIGASVWMNCA